MPDPISPVRMREIDYILKHPGRFARADIHAAAVELRAEVERLNGTPESPTDTEGTRP